MLVILQQRPPTVCTEKILQKDKRAYQLLLTLPTQTGYDSDHILSKGEVGKAGVISHIGNMEELLTKFLDKMNTSMTINAPASWLLALYIATAEKQGLKKNYFLELHKMTLQKNIYLEEPIYSPLKTKSKLSTDIIHFTTKEVPKCFEPQ